MEWIFDVATSQFLWGITLGLLLTVAVAAIHIRLEMRQKRRIVAAFCQDLVDSICELIQNLEDNRHRNKVIDHEFLETIAAEITVYGRNREHLVVLSDGELRRDIRRFFTSVAALLAQIQWRLRNFHDTCQLAQSEHDPGRKKGFEQLAANHLKEAHAACDRLRELLTQRKSLDERL